MHTRDRRGRAGFGLVFFRIAAAVINILIASKMYSQGGIFFRDEAWPHFARCIVTPDLPWHSRTSFNEPFDRSRDTI